jgi:CHAT domain-containing protein
VLAKELDPLPETANELRAIAKTLKGSEMRLASQRSSESFSTTIESFISRHMHLSRGRSSSSQR